MEGKYRAKLIDIVQSEPYLVAEVKPFPEITRLRTDEIEIEAVIRAIKQSFLHNYIGENDHASHSQSRHSSFLKLCPHNNLLRRK